MFKKFFNELVKCLKEEYKYIILLISLYIICIWPVNYYVIIGGGISDVSSRISVEEANKSKGSLNISYVTELKGTVLTYLLSYVVPDWESVSIDNYKYDESESIEDIEFRGDLDLKAANSVATKWAYTLADKEIEEVSNEIFIISLFDEYKTSLKIQDQILSINGKSFNSVLEYKDYLQTLKGEDSVIVKVKRKGKEIEIETKLYELKDKVILGVALQRLTTYEEKPPVEFKFKRSESGPSGGLITTLEIYNQLTKNDITHGMKIAGTGTIEEDGSIGTIGGVEYKILGAEKEHADIFLVPSGENYETCMKIKKKKNLKVKVISVKTIEDAIEKLKEFEK